MRKFNRLKNLNTNSVEVFYTQIKNAVAFVESNNPMSEEEKHKELEALAIMEGSKNPLSEKEKIISLACDYGFMDSMDLLELIKNDPTAALFLQR